MPRYGGILGRRNRYTEANSSAIWDIPDLHSSKINPGYPLDVVTSGLELFLDAGNPGRSPSTIWQDISGKNRHFTSSGTATSTVANTFNLVDGQGWYRLGPITNNTSCTVVMFIKTTDPQALFVSGTDLSDPSGAFYISAYSGGNTFYSSGLGSPLVTPTAFCNLAQTTNVFSTMTSGGISGAIEQWRMIEFKGVDLSIWNNWKFNMYSSFNFNSGQIGAIMVYNKSLSSAESEQNLRAFRSRYNISAGSSTLAFNRATCYVSFDGSRGANYSVDYSSDGSSWSTAWSGNMSATTCGFFDGTGGGSSYGSYRFWRYRFTSNTNSHHPRVSRIILTTTAGQSYDIINYAADNCSDSGGIPGLDRPANIIFDTLTNATVSGL